MDFMIPRKCNLRFRLAAVAVLLLTAFGGKASAFVVINEIMYHPPKSAGDVEFIEMYNDSPTVREIGGWKFTDGIEFTFPEGTSIPVQGYLVVCADPDAVRKAYRIENVIGPYKGKLDNAGEEVVLRNGTGGLIDRVDYQDDLPWPPGADGTGHSISLVNPVSENERGKSWKISNEKGGTPGRPNFPEPPRGTSIFINEVLCESSGETWLELYNATTEPVDLSGCLLSDEADKPDKFAIPGGTNIAPGGFRAFTEKELGFGLTPKRRKVFLMAPKAQYVLDALAYRETAPDETIGRWPDASDALFHMKQPTPGGANEVVLNTDVVINEIMYQPFSEDDDEYVELYNKGESPVDLAGWAFTKGIEFEFPKGTVLAPKSYLVVAKDRKRIRAAYGIENCIGDYKKRLNNDRDRLVLADALGNTVDEVTYYDGGRWPKWANGGGSSLELIDPRQDNAYPSAWAASDESAKARWTRIEYTAPHGEGRSEFQMFLVNDGMVLVDEIRLHDGDKDYLTTGTFDRNTLRWRLGGTHKYSSRWTEDTRSGGACLRIVAVGRGGTDVNSIKTRTSGTLKADREYTVSYWAKWQAGNNRLCTRTHGGGVMKTNALPVPRTLGTPGRRNSRYSANLGPIIADVQHDPVSPTTATAVTVCARVLDADGVASANVVYRIDGWTTWTTVSMNRSTGEVGASRGNDRYSAKIPEQAAGTIVEFYVLAADDRGATQTFPADAPSRTALYRVRDEPRPASPIKTIDILFRQSTSRALTTRVTSAARMDDEFLDATLVLNDARAFYNVGVRYGGSPWLRPVRGGRVIRIPWQSTTRGRRPSYRVRFNADEKLCGLQSVNFDSQNIESTRLQERMFFWLLERMGGVPFGRREFVAMHSNGRLKGVYELVQRVDRRFIKDYFPNGDDGELYKVETAYEWRERRLLRGSDFTYDRTRLQYYGPDKESYRFHFEKRSDEKDDDFSSIIELCRLFDREETSDEDFESGIEEALHVDEWLRSLACQAIAADWDGFGFMTGKNARLYRRSDSGRWVLIPYDKDLTWGGSRIVVIYEKAPGVSRLLNVPKIKRRYYSYLQELLDEPFTKEEVEPRIWAMHAVLHAAGDNATSPTPILTFVDRRRKWLHENVLPQAVDFAVETGGGDDFTTSAAVVSLEGTAPLGVREIELNGKRAEVRWTDVTGWRIEDLALEPGENRFRLTPRPPPKAGETMAEVTITRQ